MPALQNITNNFEEQLTCSLCLDVFTDPKTLPCLHSYCTRCISQWYQTSGNPFKKEMKCPMCKTTVVVPDGDPTKLPSSFYIDSLLQLLHAMKTKANQPQLSDCVNCEQPQVLVAFCAECNGFLCEDCVNLHQKVKQLRDEHHPVMLDRFKQENVNNFIKNQMMCKFHDKKKLEYYCQTCAVCICQKCATLDHQNHNMQSLEDAGQDSRTLIEAAMNGVEKRKENYGQELKQSKENIQRIQREIDTAERNVDDAVQDDLRHGQRTRKSDEERVKADTPGTNNSK